MFVVNGECVIPNIFLHTKLDTCDASQNVKE